MGVWAYCRVSTRKEEQEDSLEEQQRRAMTFAAERGLALRPPFVEQASAKTLTGRPILRSLLAELDTLAPRDRPVFLFITALDRLSRDMVDSLFIGRTLRSLKVTLFVYSMGEVKLETFAQRAVFVGQSMGGDAENEARSKRMVDSWERRRREGKTTSNKVPYGLQLRGERDVAAPDSSEWVRRAFEWYAAGEGTHVIGKRLAEGAPPHTWLTSRLDERGHRIEKTRPATRWEALRVGKLLRQARYRETIVEASLFDRVQARLADTPKYGSRRKREYPLSGSMRCHGCNRHLHGRASGHSSRYRLADGTRKLRQREPIRYYSCVVCNYSLNASRLEETFFAAIDRLDGHDDLLRRWVASPRLKTSEAAAVKTKIERLELELSTSAIQSQQDRLFDVAMSMAVDQLTLQRQAKRIEAEISSKRERLAELRGMLRVDSKASRSIEQAAALLASFRVAYDSADYERKRLLISVLVEALGGLQVSATGLIWKRDLTSLV